MYRANKNWAPFQKIKYFKNQTFQKHYLSKDGLLVQRKIFFERFDQFSALKNDIENLNFEMFEEVVHNYSDASFI
jgi:hypothetical protein